ncbi:hypothetical protein [Alteromonas ponticola]|uniref:Uncharacterized protein n=1 Tax=Alteromonas ponticola TaxID=2720613 RepID=A0ABX1QZS5_9ALTE|nr:hypothetical protein [Alteromonas ponticola]NMH58701.1 hypothetical protein [Alteromonas ponticola]
MVQQLEKRVPAEKGVLAVLLPVNFESVAMLSEGMVRKPCLTLKMPLLFAEKRRKDLRKACC